MRKAGYPTFAYLDDFAGYATTQQEATRAYDCFAHLLSDLGLQLAPEKCRPPAQQVTWLGYTLDTWSMVLSIPEEKIRELQDLCHRWLERHRVTKTMLQSLLGKILRAAPCIRHAKKFTARLLTALRNIQGRIWTTLTDDCKADILWFKHYAAKANGVTIYAQVTEYLVIECDACLTGAGGNSDYGYYIWNFPPEHTRRFKAIHHLEALNILVALRTLTPQRQLNGKGILIYTDNMASSFALTTRKTRDPVLAACAREIWLEGATRDIDIKIVHKPGADIPLADALSRASTDVDKKLYADQQITERGLIQLPPVLHGYFFFTEGL